MFTHSTFLNTKNNSSHFVQRNWIIKKQSAFVKVSYAYLVFFATEPFLGHLSCVCVVCTSLKFKLNAIDLSRFVCWAWDTSTIYQYVYVLAHVCARSRQVPSVVQRSERKKSTSILWRRHENDKHETSCCYAHFLKKNYSKINTKGRMLCNSSEKTTTATATKRWKTSEYATSITYPVIRRASPTLPHTFNAHKKWTQQKMINYRVFVLQFICSFTFFLSSLSLTRFIEMFEFTKFISPSIS